MDRIDLHVEVVPVPFKDLADRRNGEPSTTIRQRVVKARKIQEQRFKENPSVHNNAQMSSKMLQNFCDIDDVGRALLKNAMERLSLSARAYDRILKVARTIADLEASENIRTEHLAEAIQYRSLDRETWGS